MTKNQISSFLDRVREKFYRKRIDREIFGSIFPHLERERDLGYSFETEEHMDAETERLDARPVLAAIEEHIRRMPRAYGKAFRHVMHRDLNNRLRMYQRFARRQVQPAHMDPRRVAIAVRLLP